MNSLILELEDLALIRAALRFWIDEMSPHDSATWEPYFAADDACVDVSSQRTLPLLKALESIELRYFMIDFHGFDVSSVSLITEKPDSSQLAYDSTYGTALLSPHD